MEIGKAPAIPRRDTAPSSNKLARPKTNPAEKTKACAVLLESRMRSLNGRSEAIFPNVKAATEESSTVPKAKSMEKSSKRQRLPASLKAVIQDPRQIKETSRGANNAVDIEERLNRTSSYCADACELC